MKRFNYYMEMVQNKTKKKVYDLKRDLFIEYLKWIPEETKLRINKLTRDLSRISSSGFHGQERAATVEQIKTITKKVLDEITTDALINDFKNSGKGREIITNKAIKDALTQKNRLINWLVARKKNQLDKI